MTLKNTPTNFSHKFKALQLTFQVVKHRHYARSEPSVNPNLARIGEKAKAHPTLVCTSLYHHMADIEHLQACYQQLKGQKAVGVDEVTKAMYAVDLEANLQDLSARLKRMGYRPQPK